MLQGEVAVRGLPIQTGQVSDTQVGHVPAASQVQSLELLETPRDQQQAGIGDVAAPAQLEVFEILQVLRYPADGGVRHLLAERQIELGEVRILLAKSVGETGVGDVVAPG